MLRFRGAAGGDRLHRGHRPGPRRRADRRRDGEREHHERHGQVHPERHAEHADLVHLRVLPVQRRRQQVAADNAGDRAGHRGDRDEQHVTGHHLRRREADGLEHADPRGARDDRAADHVDDDQHRNDQGDHPERDDERHPRGDARLFGLADVEVGTGPPSTAPDGSAALTSLTSLVMSALVALDENR